MSTPQQRQKIRDFISFTSTNDKTASKFLTAHNWNLELAVDNYFSDPSASRLPKSASGSAGSLGRGGSGSVSTASLEKLFDKYKDPTEDLITVDGIISFLSDLSVDPSDAVTLVIGYELRAKRQGEFTRREWVDGWERLRWVVGEVGHGFGRESRGWRVVVGGQRRVPRVLQL
ncbi:hypothetical protein M427DRAFT_410222 [Gonapodya prolifera JEL478]|uniref:Defective in cullin neddylation protein n=1 Tax=Gonapodya prolifera (strain JEL478) TaxID=1344416 RepID=A0A139A5Z2_GONPJ|nr:hypothetical protein M427DRAFT_410222 [Gonapodya prolifera JEL478]|eukprot:KXS12079.1 hypothetical protein M427DRAFT_410222 [Gonapodya prolifera JEL478]